KPSSSGVTWFIRSNKFVFFIETSCRYVDKLNGIFGVGHENIQPPLVLMKKVVAAQRFFGGYLSTPDLRFRAQAAFCFRCTAAAQRAQYLALPEPPMK